MGGSAVSAFNVRVYGLWVSSANALLVTEEEIRGWGTVFKFPGGGLEFGEGTLAGLKREFLEETGLPVLHLAHFYTTDIFQESYFRPGEQLISIYYRVQCPEDRPLQKQDPTDDLRAYHWVPLAELTPAHVTLPLDQHVVRLLLAENA